MTCSVSKFHLWCNSLRLQGTFISKFVLLEISVDFTQLDVVFTKICTVNRVSCPVSRDRIFNWITSLVPKILKTESMSVIGKSPIVYTSVVSAAFMYMLLFELELVSSCFVWSRPRFVIVTFLLILLFCFAMVCFVFTSN